MSKWATLKLADAPLQILDGDRGKNYPSQDEFSDYGYCLFLSTKNVRSIGFDFSECQFVSKERDELLRKGRLQRNDVVLTTRGTVGNLGFFNDKVSYEKIRINSGMVIIRPDESKLFPAFNFYTFRKLQSDFLTFTSGSAQPQLPIRDLKEIEISIPPLEEQKAIASVLSSLDDKIDLLHRQNTTLERMAETLFRQWFVEEAQEDLEEKPLKEVVDIAIGRTPPRQEHQWFSESAFDVKWISIKDLGNDGVYIFKTSEYLTKEAVKQFNIPVIPKDTVVLSFKMTVGRVAITTEEMLSNEAIAHFKFNTKTPFTKAYLFLYLKTYKYELLGSTSSIVTSINSAMIKDMEITIPNADLMSKFQKVTEPFFGKIKANQQQIQTLEKLRDNLLPKLMSGDVRVELQGTSQ